MPAPAAVLDANVLFPAQLCDLLMRLAVEGHLRAHWTDRIHDEWTRNVLARHPGVSPDQLARTRALMEEAILGAHVEGYEPHEAGLTLPDPDDRHVLATALEAGAGFVVTVNLRDFPDEALRPHGVRAIHPDAFLNGLWDAAPAGFLQVVRAHRAALSKPRQDPEAYADRFDRAGLSSFAARLRAYVGEI